MGFNLAEAYVQLSSRGIDSVMGALGGVRSKMAGVASFATGPLGVALAGLGAGASIGGMLKLAADAEQLEVSFGVMLGGADKAKSMISDLNQFAAKTPFEMPGITQAAKTLMAFGTSQDQVIPLLRVLGDVSAGTGKDLGELSTIFGQISATGKLTGGDLMQLTNAGVPMLATLGKQLGKSQGEVKKMVEEGKISLPMVTQAFADMSGEGGLFAGMMDKQSGTLAGMWSTLKDTVGQSLTKIGAAIMESFDLKGVISGIQGFSSELVDEWLPNIVAGVAWGGENIAKPIFSAVGEIAKVVFGVIGNFDIYWQLASLYVSNFALNSFEQIKTFAINIVEMISWAMGNWRNVLFTGIDYMLTLIINLGQNIRNMWSAVLDFIAGNGFHVDFVPLTEGFRSAISQMPELTKANLDQLKPQIEEAYAELDKREKNLQAQREQRAAEAAKAAAPTALNLAGPGGGAEKKKGKEAGASFVGLSQLAEKMQEAAGAKAEMAKQTKAAETTATATDKIAAAAMGEGLKVRLTGAASSVPEVNFGFGISFGGS